MKYLKKTASEIKAMPQGIGCYYEVFYNRKEDKLFPVFQLDFAQRTWTKFEDDPEFVKIGDFEEPITMKELKELIEETVNR